MALMKTLAVAIHVKQLKDLQAIKFVSTEKSKMETLTTI